MAKKATGRANRRQGRQRKNAGLGLGAGMLAFVAAVIVIPAVAALLIVGLAPTIASWLANRSANRRNQVLTVLTFNLAGIMPYLAKVSHSPRSMGAVKEITGDVFSWLVMFGSAGAAMLLLVAAPQVAALVLQMMAQDRLKSIATAQAKLADEWGEAVSGDTGNEPAA